ncbi:MAG: NAD-dependent succinate-semialdehyde dehydrogenase [Acidimicrobiales bacterium]
MALRHHDMFIDGAWVAASDGGSYDVTNPATGDVIATAPVATTADIQRALAAAAKGWETWRETNPWDRSECLREAARYLRKREDELAALMTIEQGKPVRESLSELRGACQQYEWFADEARRIRGDVVDITGAGQFALTLRESVGPVAAFSPWNFPALLPSRKVAPALAAGCSVVLKPADETPGIAFALAAAFEHAGLPSGVFNVVTGDGAAISAQLLASSVIRKISLTGSIGVGKKLLHAAAERVVSVTMELGGHAPVVVLPDVDVAVAAQRSVDAKYRNAGQVCISPTRFYVHHDIYDEYCDAFVEAVQRLNIGDGLEPGTDVGPLANERRVDDVDRLTRDAVEHGATLAIGGRKLPKSPGYFYEPTVLVDVPENAQIMSEEPFGPIAPIASYVDVADAVARSNSTQYGLAAYVLSGEQGAGLDLARRLEAGMVGINHFSLSYAGVPFGGVKASGFGSESGPSAMNDYLVEKAVHLGVSLARSDGTR